MAIIARRVSNLRGRRFDKLSTYAFADAVDWRRTAAFGPEHIVDEVSVVIERQDAVGGGVPAVER